MRRTSFILILLPAFLLITGLIVDSLDGSAVVFFDIPRFDSNKFYDLRIWTDNFNGCEIALADFRKDNHCALSLYPFNYPIYPLYILRALGFQSGYNIVYGTTLGIASIISFVVFLWLCAIERHQCRNSFWGEWVFISFCFAAFWAKPMRYALERGQIDLVVLSWTICGLVLYHALYSRSSFSLAWMSVWLTTGLSSLAKIYPLPAFAIGAVLLVKEIKGSRQSLVCKRVNFFAVFAISVFVAVGAISSYFVASSTAFPNLGGNGFGLMVLSSDFIDEGFSLTIKSKVLVFALAFLISTLQLLKIRQVAPSFFSPKECRYRMPQLAMCLIGAFMSLIYLSTESINYKLVFVSVYMVSSCCIYSSSESVDIRSWSGFSSATCLASLSLVSLPYIPSLYVYPEWLGQFVVQPMMFGQMISFSAFYFLILASGAKGGARNKIL